MSELEDESENKEICINQVETYINNDRTTNVFKINSDKYVLVIHNEKPYEMGFKVKSGGVELHSGLVGASSESRLEINFEPFIKMRQILLISYMATAQASSTVTIMVLVDKY